MRKASSNRPVAYSPVKRWSKESPTSFPLNPGDSLRQRATATPGPGLSEAASPVIATVRLRCGLESMDPHLGEKGEHVAERLGWRDPVGSRQPLSDVLRRRPFSVEAVDEPARGVQGGHVSAVLLEEKARVHQRISAVFFGSVARSPASTGG